jgi:hypothetical protein
VQPVPIRVAGRQVDRDEDVRKDGQTGGERWAHEQAGRTSCSIDRQGAAE